MVHIRHKQHQLASVLPVLNPFPSFYVLIVLLLFKRKHWAMQEMKIIYIFEININISNGFDFVCL